MKETKFNVWNKKHKFMDTAWLIDWEHGRVCHSKHNESDLGDCILLQYTGVKDMEDLEIYEGNVLYHPMQGKREVYYPFMEHVASFGLRNIENGMAGDLSNSHIYEIIGNIYEDGSLLNDCQTPKAD